MAANAATVQGDGASVEDDEPEHMKEP
jgi:hypothetical protein